jgi:hypothetical protein
MPTKFAKPAPGTIHRMADCRWCGLQIEDLGGGWYHLDPGNGAVMVPDGVVCPTFPNDVA